MKKLILLRHAQSLWNKKNLFTGWVDVGLSQEGIKEALSAAEILKEVSIDVVYTSTLIRSITTAFLALSQNIKTPLMQASYHSEKQKLWGYYNNPDEEALSLPVIPLESLNERMYGELQGKNKKQILEQYGEEQLKLWRRSYKTPPPKGESLENTSQRVLPYFINHILPLLNEKTVLIVAHGNSLRSIIMHLHKLNEEEVASLEVPTGKPIFLDPMNNFS